MLIDFNDFIDFSTKRIGSKVIFELITTRIWKLQESVFVYFYWDKYVRLKSFSINKVIWPFPKIWHYIIHHNFCKSAKFQQALFGHSTDQCAPIDKSENISDIIEKIFIILLKVIILFNDMLKFVEKST